MLNGKKERNMKRYTIQLLILLVISSLLSACSNQSTDTSSNPFEGMQLATLSNGGGSSSGDLFTSTPASAASSVLFSDDFSDPSSGWQVSEDEYGKTAYENRSYIVEAYKKGYTFWGTASQNFTDVKIDVDAHVTNTADNENNAFGVDCRVQSNGDGYSFHISSDGYYSIIKFQNLKAVPLVDWTPSTDIPTGDQTVHITALCQGQHLQLWVNNISIAETDDATFTQGDLSLSAATLEDNQSTVVAFTNYVVSNPGTASALPAVTLTVNNPTDQDACGVFVVDQSTQTWGTNLLLGDEKIAAGTSKEFSISSTGIRDVEVNGCDYLDLLTTYGLDLSQDQTITLIQPKLAQAWEFTAPDSAWTLGNLKNGSASLTNDDYLSLNVTQPNEVVSLSPTGYTAADTIVRTDAMLVKPGDSQDASFGVMCRVQTEGSGILFSVRSNGTASIQKVVQGKLTPLLDWKSSTFIQKGIASNIIEGDCVGSKYSLYVNGDFIGAADDSTYTNGMVGLAALYSSDPIQVDFDYLKVYTPTTN